MSFYFFKQNRNREFCREEECVSRGWKISICLYVFTRALWSHLFYFISEVCYCCAGILFDRFKGLCIFLWCICLLTKIDERINLIGTEMKWSNWNVICSKNTNFHLLKTAEGFFISFCWVFLKALFNLRSKMDLFLFVISNRGSTGIITCQMCQQQQLNMNLTLL